jgi:hypothetical protein
MIYIPTIVKSQTMIETPNPVSTFLPYAASPNL